MIKFEHAIFVSDVHLSDVRINEFFIFQDFLVKQTKLVDDLVILGDCFDLYVNQENMQVHRLALELLKELSKQCRIWFMRGNHDFFMEASTLQAFNIRSIPDPSVCEINGVRTVLTHGDKLVTRDFPYQRASINRYRWLEPAKELDEEAREKFWIDFYSKNSPAVPFGGADVLAHPFAIRRMLRAWQAQNLIHGHTHRAESKDLEIALTMQEDEPAHQILTLGDWSKTGGVFAQVKDGLCELHHYGASGTITAL